MRFIALMIFVLLSGCQCPGTLDDGRSVRPRFEVEIHRPENGHKLLREVRPTFVGGAVVFDVVDKFGIGSATVRLLEGSWPGRVLVRYHLGGLEGASAAVDGKLLLDSRKDPRGALGIRMLDKKGRPLAGKYLLKKAGYYEARIPRRAFPDGARELKLTWVDFYRG